MQLSPGTYAFGAVLMSLVIAITMIDLKKLIIPDILNISLAATGLGYQFWSSGRIPLTAIAFSLGVLALFWALRQAFRIARGHTGLGLGDVKMAGASALWISPWNLALFLLVTCIAALSFVFFSYLRGGTIGMKTKVPFGPFLSLGIFVTWLLENSGMPTFIPDGGI